MEEHEPTQTEQVLIALCEAMNLKRVVSLELSYDFVERGPLRAKAICLIDDPVTLEVLRAEVVRGTVEFRREGE